MYTIINAAKNLIRYRRRTIISALLLTAVFAVIVNQLFLREHYSEEIRKLKDIHENRWMISFRDELQYEGNPVNYSGMEYYEDCTGKRTYIFDAEEMAEYNHPYPMTEEMYEKIADVPYVHENSLAYMTKAYCTSDIVPEGASQLFSGTYDKTVMSFTIVGGDREEFVRTVNEYNRGMREFRLTEGRYPEAYGECTITSYAASLFSKSVGDTIELYDLDGNIRAEFVITGLTALYYADCPYESPNQLAEQREISWDITNRAFSDNFKFSGTPFDRFETSHEDVLRLGEIYPDSIKLGTSIFGVMFTTFDTAYGLDEVHHINNFTFSADVEEGHAEEWAEHIRTVLPEEYADEFTVYHFDNTLRKLTERRLTILENTGEILPPACLIAVGIMLLTIVSALYERRHDTGVFYSVGVSESRMSITHATEHALTAFLSVLLSAIAAVPCLRFSEMNHYFLAEEQLAFRLPHLYILFVFLIPAAAFVLSYTASSLMMAVKTPVGMLRRE